MGFKVASAKVEPTKRTQAPVIHDEYRPIFDAIAATEIGSGDVTDVTFEPTDGRDADTEARRAKLTIQNLARQAGFTAREPKGSRVVKGDAVTVRFVKRPAKRASESAEVAPVE